MSPVTLVFGVVLAAAAVQPAGPACSPAALEVTTAAARAVASGAYDEAAELLRVGIEQDRRCAALIVAAWASRGWLAARGAAGAGGTPEALADVRAAEEILGPLGAATSPAAYAVAVLRAASAAAQDEREEMTLWLDHAREISRRLAVAGAAPHWPLPVALADGELWLEVDDFELAQDAYVRALADADSVVAWLGLARSRRGLGKRAEACEAYGQVLIRLKGTTVPHALDSEARSYVRECVR